MFSGNNLFGDKKQPSSQPFSLLGNPLNKSHSSIPEFKAGDSNIFGGQSMPPKENSLFGASNLNPVPLIKAQTHLPNPSAPVLGFGANPQLS